MGIHSFFFRLQRKQTIKIFTKKIIRTKVKKALLNVVFAAVSPFRMWAFDICSKSLVLVPEILLVLLKDQMDIICYVQQSCYLWSSADSLLGSNLSHLCFLNARKENIFLIFLLFFFFLIKLQSCDRHTDAVTFPDLSWETWRWQCGRNTS